MNGIVKKIVSVLLLFVIAGLVYVIVQSVMQPVNFNKQMEYRKGVGVQRMKDLRRKPTNPFTEDSPSLPTHSRTSTRTVRWKF